MSQQKHSPKGNFPYYCASCGGALDGERVLFDMSGALFGGKMKILKLRLSEEELRAILNRMGTSGMAELSLGELLGYMANPRNLNDPDVTELTMEQLRKFRADMEEYIDQQWFHYEATVNTYDEGDIFALFDEPAEDEQEKNDPMEKEYDGPKLPEFSAVIRRMEKDYHSPSEDRLQEMLADDMRLLTNALNEDGVLRFALRLITEEDDAGDQVVTGVEVTDKAGVRRLFCNRVCPDCGAPVIVHAGTSDHKVVLILGQIYTGKTSTFLALTDYARNGMKFRFRDDPIWSNAEQIPGIHSVELLRNERWINNRLENYYKGIDPGKTDYGYIPYEHTTTLRITSGNDHKRCILTLMDSPGEFVSYSEWTEPLRSDSLLNEWAMALNCDALVVCVDAQRKEDKRIRHLRNTFAAANAFQKLRRISKGGPPVPTMVLYNRCPELEQEWVHQPVGTASVVSNAPDGLYMFREERAQIQKMEYYWIAEQMFEEFEELYHTFRASLRFSPSGHEMVYPWKLEEGEDVRLEPPRPVHVDRLMQWLLMVTGSIPVVCPAEADVPEELENYRLERNQYRSENPRVKGGVSAEAVARCVLFTNPGVHDRYLVEHRDQKAAGMFYQLRMREDSNG